MNGKDSSIVFSFLLAHTFFLLRGKFSWLSIYIVSGNTHYEMIFLWKICKILKVLFGRENLKCFDPMFLFTKGLIDYLFDSDFRLESSIMVWNLLTVRYQSSVFGNWYKKTAIFGLSWTCRWYFVSSRSYGPYQYWPYISLTGDILDHVLKISAPRFSPNPQDSKMRSDLIFIFLRI